MDANESDLGNQTKGYGVNNIQGYGTSVRVKVPAMDSRVISQHGNASHEEVGVDDEETSEEVEKINGVRVIGKDSYDNDDVSDDDDDDEDEDDNEEKEDGGVVGDISDDGKMGDTGIEQPQKKRKLKTLVSNYEFAPRVRAPPAHVAVQSEPSSIGQDNGGSWTNRETFVLLDAWGDQFVKLGRKSLFSNEWQEVANKVLEETNIERTVSQCRGRLDTLKKKYRKEKTRSTSSGDVGKWVFFKKMDMLLGSPSYHRKSLSCGIDSGEYVFMNPKVYLNRANGLDEMKDSPENSESSRDDKNNLDGKRKKGRRGDGRSFQLLADSIQKFSEIYEDIEINRRKQMVDLENMRMDFQRQMEMQMRQILESAQAEIVKIIQDADDEHEIKKEKEKENDLSAEKRIGTSKLESAQAEIVKIIQNTDDDEIEKEKENVLSAEKRSG